MFGMWWMVARTAPEGRSIVVLIRFIRRINRRRQDDHDGGRSDCLPRRALGTLWSGIARWTCIPCRSRFPVTARRTSAIKRITESVLVGVVRIGAFSIGVQVPAMEAVGPILAVSHVGIKQILDNQPGAQPARALPAADEPTATQACRQKSFHLISSKMCSWEPPFAITGGKVYPDAMRGQVCFCESLGYHAGKGD